MPMRVLITGGAGFIGSHLVEAFLQTGANVHVLDNLRTGRRENLQEIVNRYHGRESVRLFEGDITDPHAVQTAAMGADYILHQAALPSVQRSVEDPLSTNRVNVEGTLNVLNAARALGVRRVVYASSSSVYGDSPQLPKVESATLNPSSPYAVSKLAGEAYCRAFTRVYGLETVALRYFNVFGPRQDPTSPYAAVIPRFIEALLQSKAPVIYGDGTQSRDFTFIENVVRANVLAVQAPDVAGEVFNIACGEGISLLTIVQWLEGFFQRPVHPEFQPPRAGDIRHSRADISKAERMLGYRPLIGFQTGLEQTVRSYLQRRGNS